LKRKREKKKKERGRGEKRRDSSLLPHFCFSLIHSRAYSYACCDRKGKGKEKKRREKKGGRGRVPKGGRVEPPDLNAKLNLVRKEPKEKRGGRRKIPGERGRRRGRESFFRCAQRRKEEKRGKGGGRLKRGKGGGGERPRKSFSVLVDKADLGEKGGGEPRKREKKTAVICRFSEDKKKKKGEER